MVGLAVIVAAVVAARYLGAEALLVRALDKIGRLGAWGVVLFALLYVLATVLFLPGWILTVGAGALFGVVEGLVVVSIGSTLGATAAFLVGRYVARDWVARRIEGNTTVEAIDEAVGREGGKIVGLTRLSPVVPFNLLNYALVLTGVSLRAFVLASWIGMLPGTLLYVYLGSVAGDLASFGSAARARTPAEWALYAVGLLATVAVSVYVTRLARSALRTQVGPRAHDGRAR